jgi:tripartite-type tricarboxylate transporter receptor subunit TctC
MHRSSPGLLVVAILALTATVCAPPAQPGPSAARTAATPTQPSPPAAQTGATPAAKPAPSDQGAVAGFYRGKTIRIVAGAPPAGLFDQFSRLLARHMPKYLPGQPTIIVENRPGAGTMLAANAVYNVEPKDGTVIAHINSGLSLLQAIGGEGIQFDIEKFTWLGAAMRDPQVCVARADLGIQSVQELIRGRELIVGTSGPGSNLHDTPHVLKEALGINFRLVSGYGGMAPIVLAFEGKEVDGYCSGMNSVTSQFGRLLEGENPSGRPIVVTGAEPLDHPLLKGVPAAETLAPTEEVRQLLRAVDAPNLVAFPWAVAPGVPQERVEALRKALADTFGDPEFQAEAKRANLDPGLSTGDEVARHLQSVVQAPPGVLARLKEVLKQ